MRRAFLVLALVSFTRAWSWRAQGDEPVQLPETREVQTQTQTCSSCQFTGVPPEEEEDSVLSARVEEDSYWLTDIEERLETVQSRFDDLVSRARNFIHQVDMAENDLDRLEGSACPQYEHGFYCGMGECIDSELVCDGPADCFNGHDEDEDACEEPAPAGSAFDIELDGDDPCTIRQPTRIRVAVLTSDRSSGFRSVARLQLSLVVRFTRDQIEQEETLNAEGLYYFGRGDLIVFPPDIADDNRLMLALRFTEVNRREPRGYIYHEASNHVCLRFYAHRVD